MILKMKIRLTPVIFLLPLILIVAVTACKHEPEEEDFMRTSWVSTTYTLDSKAHDYDSREVLIFRRDGTVMKKVLVMDTTYNYHKGLWKLSQDKEGLLLAFQIDPQLGRPTFDHAIRWEINEFTHDKLLIETMVPGRNSLMEVEFRRDDEHKL